MFPFVDPKYEPENEKTLLFLPFHHLFGLSNSLAGLWLGYTGIIVRFYLIRSNSSCYKRRKGFKFLILSIAFQPPTVLQAHSRQQSLVIFECIKQKSIKIRYLACVPPTCVFLANNPLVDQYDLRSLKCLLSAAAPVGQEVCNKIKKRLGVKFIGQAYGMVGAIRLDKIVSLLRQKWEWSPSCLLSMSRKSQVQLGSFEHIWKPRY